MRFTGGIRGAASVAAACAALALAGCSAGRLKPGEPVAIAYGGEAGERRLWRVELAMRGEVSFGGLPQLVTMKVRGSVLETVAEVLPGGGRRLVQRWEMEAPEFNGMPLAAGVSATAIETGLMRTPSGETVPLEGGREEADLLLWAARTFGGFFPLLPQARVSLGEKWSLADNSPSGGGLEVQRVVNGILESLERGIARISTDGSVSLAKAGPGAPVQEFRVECGGSVDFDVARGLVASSTQSGTIRLKGHAGKTPVSARARFESSMKLDEAVPR